MSERTSAIEEAGVKNPNIVFSTRRFTVEQHEVRDRNGAARLYDKIVLPGAAVALPVLDDGRIVLIRNYRFVVEETLLELPAGMLDEGESPMECARRELMEETGFRAGQVTPLLSFYSTPGMCNEVLHSFLVTDLVSGESAREPGEQIENHPMVLVEALRAIGDGRVKDAKTIVTLLYYERYVRERG